MDFLRDPRFPDVDPLPLLDDKRLKNLRVILKSVERRNRFYGLTGRYRLQVMLDIERAGIGEGRRFLVNNVTVSAGEDFPWPTGIYPSLLSVPSQLRKGIAIGSYMHTLRVGRYREILRFGERVENPPIWSNVTSKVLADFTRLLTGNPNNDSEEYLLERNIQNDGGFVMTNGIYEISENLQYYYRSIGIVGHEVFTVFGKFSEHVIAGLTKKHHIGQLLDIEGMNLSHCKIISCTTDHGAELDYGAFETTPGPLVRMAPTPDNDERPPLDAWLEEARKPLD